MASESFAMMTPSLIDRLVDVSAGHGESRWQSQRQFVDSICRDIEELLNARISSQGLIDGYDGIEGSIVAFGIPDMASLSVANDRHCVMLEKTIEEAIVRFESRLAQVRVKIAPPAQQSDQVLRVEVSGVILAGSELPFNLSGMLRGSTGEITMAQTS